ncbi:MAG: DMT family protein [Alcanivoracaceae bacterium]|nr:DMT family protein [Alcanivoracaceae bacterium]
MKETPEVKSGTSTVSSQRDGLSAESPQGEHKAGLIYFIVPLMLLFSSAIMATAWLGHLRFKEDLTFLMATLFAWLLVLPEYALNILALRLGYRKFTGGQMGAFRLCTGVVAIAFVSHYMLGEELTIQKLLGFGVMAFSMILISSSSSKAMDQ